MAAHVKRRSKSAVNGDDEVAELQFQSKLSGSSKPQNLWLAPDPSKRWGEIYFLAYTSFWLPLCLGIVVPYRLYEGDVSKHWYDRYWAKAQLWILIFSYVGNYFLTHYFFTVLGASYTFPSWRMNNVPHMTFLMAHACFLFYHTASNITLRRLRYAISELPSCIQFAIQAFWIFAFSYFIAFLETFAIANFPYYDFVDRAAMYKVGSLFYAIYFFVSFPMFIRLDEKPKDPWNLSRTAIDALGAAMLVTIMLDSWRLFLGPIVEIPRSIPYKECLSYGLPWMS